MKINEMDKKKEKNTKCIRPFLNTQLMKKSILLILFLFSTSLCFSQRNDPYFHSSRIIKSLYGSYGNDNVGYFWGQILLDSASHLLQNHIGKVSIKSVN